MACISRRPRCGAADADVVPEPLTDIAAVIGTIVGVIGGVASVLGFLGKLTVEAGALVIAGVSIGAGSAGALSGFAAGVAVIILVGVYAFDRCIEGEGLRECVAGVVNEVIGSFSEAIEEVFPFAGMHDRVDLVVKSRFWDVVESGSAFVHCTDEEPPRRSEIMRCYYYDERVCNAAVGAIYGAAVGAVGGIIAAAAIAAAIGCATVILCIFALILAALVAAVAALVGAFAGGQIAKAASEDDTPTADTGETIAVSDLLTVHGNMQRREHDDDANVLWWVRSTSFHGRASDGLPRPFSYCEIDEELPTDGCPLPGPD